MARMRYIKAEFWTDSAVVRMSPWARLLFIGSWNFALCEAGHLPDDAMALKLKVLPADSIDADEVLEEVIASGRIERKSTSEGRTYLHIVNLSVHQKTDARWATRCPYCASESSPGLTETRESFSESSDSHRLSPQEGIGGEGIGDTKPSSSETADAVPDATSSEDGEPAREDVDHLCRLLVELMVANGSRKRNVTKAWRREARLLLDRDGISPDLAEHVLRWALGNSFWKSNIESMPTFREKFDRLRLQRREEYERNQAGNVRNLPPQAPKPGSGAWGRQVVLPGPDDAAGVA